MSRHCQAAMLPEAPSEPGDGMVLVELRPFPHQAGGHTAVLELNKSTICKPFEEREAWFYENEPETLLEFTPKYLGETEVTCSMCHERLHLTAAVPKVLASQRGLSTFDPRAVSSTPSSPVSNILTKRKGRKRCLNSDDSSVNKSSDVTSCLEVWSMKCIERQIDRYGFWANNQPQKFIMLENLVHTYRKPCLMDLKMGRRQFGDDSSAEKKQLLVARCAQSTSATLGLRISGTQVYQASTDQYCVHDKYVGRDLDNQGAVREIRHFFFNGIAVRTDAIGHVIQKLERLKSALIDCATLNFYSCSLLLIYEGWVDSLDCRGSVREAPTCVTGPTHNDETEVEQKDDAEKGDKDGNILNKVDVRLIDFAHVSEKKEFQEEVAYLNGAGHVENVESGASKTEEGKVDDTVIFGIEQLLEVLKKLRVQ